MKSPHMRSDGARLVVCLNTTGGDAASHEIHTRHTLARQIAALRGWPFGGEYEAGRHPSLRPYFVPADTLDTRTARALGVQGEDDLFGGVVPRHFVGTKAISHPLVSPRAVAPSGWAAALAEQMRSVTLPGFSAFSLRDALEAGRRLLAHGSVRVKLATGVGGIGQSVVRDAGALEAVLSAFDTADALGHGVVLEPNMVEIETYSIGQVRLGELLISYYGQQRQTENNRGVPVYGGSDLELVRGDFAALAQRRMPPQLRLALEQARLYHAAAVRAYPGVFASRCNYDVAQGQDESGTCHAGVLEQSWRAGGASGAELAAMEVFAAYPHVQAVRASTTEIYGESPSIPRHATVYFSGLDPRAGWITKYACMDGYDDDA